MPSSRNTVRPSREIMGYEAYTVSFFRHAHDGREGWEAWYDGRTQGWFWTEEEAWDRLRELAKEYGDLPDEDFDVEYGRDAQGLHTAVSPQYRGLRARGRTDDEATRKLVGMINLVRRKGNVHCKGRDVTVGRYTIHVPEYGRPVVLAEGSGDFEMVACDPVDALVAFAKEVEELRSQKREEATVQGGEYDPARDPDVGLCDYVRERVLSWKPSDGKLPPQIEAALPDIAAFAAMSLLMKFREQAAEAEVEAMDHPFAGLVPETVRISPEACERLTDILENPPPPNAKLRSLMRTHALWKKDIDKEADTSEGLDA